jgi:hypothetical protein
MREIRPSGRVHQNAAVVTPSPAACELPMMGVAALLQLADWSHARRRGFSQEEPHASTSNRRCPPPRPRKLTRPRQPSQLWRVLPLEDRARILNALSRVVAEHLTLPPKLKEVTHEQP